MNLTNLVRSLLAGDALAARQWVSDVLREQPLWVEVEEPLDLDPTELALAAGVVELLAERCQRPAPSWTREVGAAPELVYLVESAKTLPRLRRLCQEEGPLPLRRRGFLAPPEFLTVAQEPATNCERRHALRQRVAKEASRPTTSTPTNTNRVALTC